LRVFGIKWMDKEGSGGKYVERERERRKRNKKKQGAS
jgi:hypothetical protein